MHLNQIYGLKGHLFIPSLTRGKKLLLARLFNIFYIFYIEPISQTQLSISSPWVETLEMMPKCSSPLNGSLGQLLIST